MVQKLKRTQINSHSCGRNPLKNITQVLLKNRISYTMNYLKNEIIPEIERKDDEQLSIEELTQIAEKLEEVVEDYTQKIDSIR